MLLRILFIGTKWPMQEEYTLFWRGGAKRGQTY
jgi:hypothetical protein